jgi:hypothetical protein
MKPQRFRMYQRKGVWWVSYTQNRVTVRRSTREVNEERARAVVETWPELPPAKSFAFDEVGVVYFIEAIGTDWIKVGWTRSDRLDWRLVSMQVGCPFELRVVAQYTGLMFHERAEHRRWAPWRGRGEWFRASPELREHITEISRRDPTANQRQRTKRDRSTRRGS